MSSTNFEQRLDWYDIEEHTLVLRGVSHAHSDAPAALIKFVARSVLSRPDSIHSPAEIAFDTTITIGDELQYRSCIGNDSLIEQRAALAALQSGAEKEAKLSMLGLDLHIYEHQWGARSGLCVEGVASSISDAPVRPWPERAQKIGDWLLDGNRSACCLRFAFVTSLVDPPYIDSFIRDIDSLLLHLRQFADA